MAEKEFNGECRVLDENSGEELLYSYKVVYTTGDPILWSSLISVDGEVKGAPSGRINNFPASIAEIEPILRDMIETNIVEFVGISRP